MQSEIRVKSPSVKITITLGFFLTLIIIFLAVWYSTETRIIILSTGGAIVLFLVSFTGHKVIVWRLHRKEIGLNIKRQQLEIERLELSRFILNFPQNERLIIPTEHASRITVIEPVKPVAANLLPALPETIQAPLDFMQLLPKLQTVVIVGGQNSGKTSLLHNIAHNRLQSGVVVAIDPHSDKWPSGANVVGTGRDYRSIDAVLGKLAQLLDNRYKTQQPGKLVTIVADEWLSIVDNCDNAADNLKLFLTEGRKVNIHLFLGSHTDRARQLGLSGYADMREGLSLVYLAWQPATNERSAEIMLNGKRQPVVIPPPIEALGKAQVLRLNAPTRPVNSQKARMLALYENGKSFNEIAQEIYGSKGGWQTSQIKKTLGV